MTKWFELQNVDKIDSPTLVIFRDRVEENIKTLVRSINDPSRLRPHVKTHKSHEVTKMMLEHGIRKFKCATIAEAEMTLKAGAKDVLLAYQPVGPKAQRLLQLIKEFPNAKIACLIDNIKIATALAALFDSQAMSVPVYIDLNVGMNRTGIAPGEAFELAKHCTSLKGLELKGLHAYDGHIRDTDFTLRRKRSDEAFAQVEELRNRIKNELNNLLDVVVGGTPTYSVHVLRSNVECSPGTFIYWDKGYEAILQEQKYLHAAVVITRVISKPAAGIICVDLGHKSIASENPLTNRVSFINAPDVTPVGHSEEHMVLKYGEGDNFEVGDVLYGIPYHVCPTVALYERTAVATEGKVTEWWMTESRNKRINF